LESLIIGIFSTHKFGMSHQIPQKSVHINNDISFSEPNGKWFLLAAPGQVEWAYMVEDEVVWSKRENIKQSSKHSFADVGDYRRGISA
jgi:hypothetical protein